MKITIYVRVCLKSTGTPQQSSRYISWSGVSAGQVPYLVELLDLAVHLVPHLEGLGFGGFPGELPGPVLGLVLVVVVLLLGVHWCFIPLVDLHLLPVRHVVPPGYLVELGVLLPFPGCQTVPQPP